MRNIRDLIKYEARRRPAIGDLYERAMAGTLTQEDIDNAEVPLPWYRKALSVVLSDHQAGRITFDLQRMIDDGSIQVGYQSDQQGTTMTYFGEDEFIRVSSKSEILVQDGRPVFFPETGGVWIDTIFTNNIDPKLLQRCKNPTSTSRMGYQKIYRESIKDLKTEDDPDYSQSIRIQRY